MSHEIVDSYEEQQQRRGSNGEQRTAGIAWNHHGAGEQQKSVPGEWERNVPDSVLEHGL